MRQPRHTDKEIHAFITDMARTLEVNEDYAIDLDIDNKLLKQKSLEARHIQKLVSDYATSIGTTPEILNDYKSSKGDVDRYDGFRAALGDIMTLVHLSQNTNDIYHAESIASHLDSAKQHFANACIAMGSSEENADHLANSAVIGARTLLSSKAIGV
jgi:hypothetical protein